MIPANNIPHRMGHDLESSEDESSYSSIDSTSSGDSISTDEFDVPSTSMVPPMIMVYLPSPVSSAGVTDLTSPIQSTASMPPVHPMPPADPMSPVPFTSRGIQKNCDDYRFETARRWSFRSWPISFIDPASLAAAGFYYTNETDVVRCFECQLLANRWRKGDIPMQIHEMRSPQCRFIRNEHCNNVPIGVDPDKVLWTFWYHRILGRLVNPTADDLIRFGIKDVKKPKHLEYVSYESRLNTFAAWPTCKIQTREVLADAGFYCDGMLDLIICYHCGIGIGEWTSDEDPWEEHAIVSPKCCYLLAVRGWEYVNKVTGKKIYETSAEAPTEIADENPERSNSENDTNEMILVEKVAALEEENRALKDDQSCKVCMERKATIICLPCGHIATCQYCSPAFTKCIICRNRIKGTVRIFLA